MFSLYAGCIVGLYTVNVPCSTTSLYGLESEFRQRLNHKVKGQVKFMCLVS